MTFQTGYKGFLLIRCSGCGREYFINAREPETESTCRYCGQVTRLENLASAELYCRKCDRTWRYRTNSEEAEVSCSCINCGEELSSQWNSKLRRYMPRK